MVFEMLMEMYFNLNGDVYVLFTTDLPRKVNLPHTLRNVPISHNIRFFKKKISFGSNIQTGW